MNFIITLLILIFILGIIILIHEWGHFITAKKAGVYVNEFSLGMGPLLFKFKPKNSETTYSVRAFPVGGYVSMAEKDGMDKSIKKDRVLENKSFIRRLLVLIMGIVMNFVLAIVVFFISGLIYGRSIQDTSIGMVLDGSPCAKSGLEVGDVILKINDTKMDNWDDILLEISAKKLQDNYVFEVKKTDGSIKKYDVVPEVTMEEDIEKRLFGVGASAVRYEKGFKNALIYSVEATGDTVNTIFKILGSLFTGKVSLNNLSGPVGIYTVVDQVKSSGLQPILYLIAYLSLNVGIINLIPVPVFDGGRVLLLLIETISKKKPSEKLEIALNYIGFLIMIILMLYVTYNDVTKLFR